MEWSACGNGAADLIWRIVFAMRPQKALVTAPTFSEYETALVSVECCVEHHLLTEKKDFHLREDILGKITEETDILFLCNPNNPTGLMIEKKVLLQILERCRVCDVLMVVDKCFLGFLPNADSLTLRPQLSSYPNLLILEAFTKLYGMAGLRLGYCLCSDTALLAALEKAGQCWPVSVVADGTEDGAVCGNICGTYLHGLFDGELAGKLAGLLLLRKGITPEEGKTPILDAAAFHQAQYDILAKALRENLDMDALYRILEKRA